MLRVVLTNRKLSDGFFMLAGPLAHSHEKEDVSSLGCSLEAPSSGALDSRSCDE